MQVVGINQNSPSKSSVSFGWNLAEARRLSEVALKNGADPNAFEKSIQSSLAKIGPDKSVTLSFIPVRDGVCCDLYLTSSAVREKAKIQPVVAKGTSLDAVKEVVINLAKSLQNVYEETQNRSLLSQKLVVEKRHTRTDGLYFNTNGRM